jgi:hypothetical protein
MATYCSISDFTGYPYELPNEMNLNNRLKGAIQYYELKLIKRLFSPDYITAFNLVDDDALDNLLKEALIPYTYFHFIQTANSQVTSTGYQVNVLENTKSTIDKKRLCMIHNDYIDKLSLAIDYMDENSINYNILGLKYINEFGI